MKSGFLGAFVLMLGVMLIASPSAFAGGTRGGSTITNTATLTYYAGGGGTQLSETATAVVTVEYVAGVSLTAASPINAGDGTTVYVPITITNTGNATDTYALSYAPPAGWTATIYQDVNGNGVLDAEDTVVVSSTGPLNGWTYDSTGAPATEETYSVIVALTVPQDLPVGNQYTGTLTVTGTDVDPGAGTAQIPTTTRDDDVTIQRASLTSTKSEDHTVGAGYGLENGDKVRYTITVTNSSNASALTAESVLVTDKLPSQVTYNAYVSGPGTVTTSADSVYWSPGNITAGSTVTLVFDVTINNGVAGGTTVNNTANVAYDDANINGVWTRTATSNTASFTVVGYAWAVDIADSASTSFGSSITDSVEPNNAIIYRVRLTNNGSTPDSVTFSFLSSVTNPGASASSWTWSIYLDDNDGVFEPAGQDGSPLTMAYNSSSVSASGTLYFWARFVPAYNTPYNAFDVTQFIATSQSNTSIKDTATSTTNVNAPFITLTKAVYDSVAGFGSQASTAAPGTVLYYVITFNNGGDATASTVTLSDAIPTNTTYRTSSVEISSDGSSWSARADDGSDSGGNITASQAGGVSYTFGSLTAGQTGYMRFRVTVN